MIRWIALFPLIAISMCGVGCDTQYLARQMIEPRRHAFSLENTAKNEKRIDVDCGDATLAVWIVDPVTPAVPRGTILLLHGYDADHTVLRKEAEALWAAGYRAVMVDLRGHGKSGGDSVTFGARESRELKRLADYLQQQQLAGATIGVYGVSYGAAIAIQYAAIDDRVAAVVAVATYTSMREAIPQFRRFFRPLQAVFVSDQQSDAVIEDAGKLGGFNPDANTPLDSIGRTHAQILLIHGRNDNVVSAANSARLHEADPVHSQLTLLPDAGHLAVSFEKVAVVRSLSVQWFEAHLKITPAETSQRS